MMMLASLQLEFLPDDGPGVSRRAQPLNTDASEAFKDVFNSLMHLLRDLSSHAHMLFFE